MLDSPKVSARPKITWRPSITFCIVAAIVLLLVIIFAAAGGFGGALVILGIVALITGLYALLFKRRTWVGIPHRKSALLVVGSGIVVFILGGSVLAATASSTGGQAESALVEVSATATPTPTATNPAKTACLTADETKTFNGALLVCTMGADQRLVWLPEAESKVIVAKAAADKVAADKAAADKVAAEKAAADKAAADSAAADKVAADKIAAQQAAAAQQSAKTVPAAPVAPAVPAVPAVPAAAAYANCTAARAAGAAPVYRGSPGYGTHLDRDGDGIGCDK
jgi:hypothetical protein